MELLRFATAGSVDDGKSTLIGRLLLETKQIFEDQLEAVERTSRDRGFDYTNLALVCRGGAENHHPQLVPHGPWLLLGNPNQPDGLRLVHRDQIPDLDHYIRLRRPPTLEELGLEPRHPGRAGPTAA